MDLGCLSAQSSSRLDPVKGVSKKNTSLSGRKDEKEMLRWPCLQEEPANGVKNEGLIVARGRRAREWNRWHREDNVPCLPSA